MPFSYEQTINLLNNAANELTRAARDFGDNRPDNELTARLHGAARYLGDVLKDLEAERDFVANGPQVTTASRVAAAVETDVTLREVPPPAAPVTPPVSTDSAIVAANQPPDPNGVTLTNAPAVAPVIDTPPDPKPSASAPASGKTPKADTASS